jgi:hypothetical protein
MEEPVAMAHLADERQSWFSHAFLITDLLTVGLHLRDVLEILLRLDDRQMHVRGDCSR